MSPPDHCRRLTLPVITALGLAVAGCQAAARLSGSPSSPGPMPAGIAVAFNHNDSQRYRSPIDGQWRRGDDLEALILGGITGARQEILVAVQELSLPRVAEALVKRHREGLTVKVVLENTYSAPWSQEHPADLSPHQRTRHNELEALGWGDAVAILRRGGVPFIDDTADGSKGSGLMHSKFMVVDRRVVITGSANFTPSCVHGDRDDPRTRGNVNHLLRLDSTALAALFTREFERMWGDGPDGATDSRFGIGKQSEGLEVVQVGNTPVGVLFAPHRRHDPNHGLTLINTLLAGARRQVDLALFVLSDQSVTDTLGKLQRRGVKIRLLADPGFANRSFSEVLDLLGTQMTDRHCKLEAGNKPLREPLEGVGTPRLARGDKLHHKLAVIDGQRVITGSFNWSPSAAHQNDETLLVIDSPLLAKHFSREIDRMWRGAELGISARLSRKLERQQALCGSGVQRS
jgi:phosphatidylserine/phosphatidylglycerophosphate/cardiolipin synthase-like enzyme